SPSPLPRRVPQTSLAAELREEPPGAHGRTGGTGGTATAPEDRDSYPDFTAERAAASLAGFQRGTLQAHDEEPEERDGRFPDSARRPLTKDTP
ncbi:hypothetical protein J7I94_27210, partial [Streptomyces sp. ISL-12]|uniref:hypothetical protein n=1 Tax=Streptomyces sp. ISL-12 TaxID=2819177 RepID=UPI001BE5DF5D